MALVKFITVFDDEYSSLISPEVLKRYEISAYPSIFFCDSKPYFDGVNVCSVDYVGMHNHSETCTDPTIPVKIFKYAIEKAYDKGFNVVIIVCPHGKWYPYYENACRAVKNFKRRKYKDLTTFALHVVDSKSFAAGSLFHLLTMARKHVLDHCASELVVEHGRKSAVKNFSYLISDCKTVFSDKAGELYAYKLHGYKQVPLNITDYDRFVQYNKFAQTVARKILEKDSKYVISFGPECDFATYVVGLIEELTGKIPVCSMQYSVPSAAVLGDRTLCIHLFNEY